MLKEGFGGGDEGLYHGTRQNIFIASRRIPTQHEQGNRDRCRNRFLVVERKKEVMVIALTSL